MEKKESVVNRTGKRDKVLVVANVSLLAGISLLAATIVFARQYAAGLMLLMSVGIGYMYQGPPFRLSYKGLGEILCFFAFGPLATSAFFMVQSGFPFQNILQSPMIIAVSSLVGLSTSNILLNSHYHQIETDAKEGKISPAVRFGSQNVAYGACTLVSLTYLLHFAFLYLRILPLSTIIAIPFTATKAFKLCDFVLRNHKDKATIKPAKFYAVKWHQSMIVLLSLGLFLSR